VLIVAVALYGLRWSVMALRNYLRLAPRVAAGDRTAQASVTQRPEAFLFGVPNSAFGTAYYATLLALALTGRLFRAPWRSLTRTATLVALARTLTLLVDLARTRTWCAVCMRAHVANAALAFLLLPRRDRRE
jgi:uncharacterized membrane protein